MPARPGCVVLQSFGGSPSIHIDYDRNLNICYMAATLALFILLNNRHYGPIAYKHRIIFFAGSLGDLGERPVPAAAVSGEFLAGRGPDESPALALSAMVTAWVAWVASLSPPLSGGIAVVVTAALLPAPLGSVQDVPPDQCPVGSHSCVFLCCRAVLSDQGSNVSAPAIRSTA